MAPARCKSCCGATTCPPGFYDEVWKRLVDLGDFVSATGPLFVTKTGELSVRCALAIPEQDAQADARQVARRARPGEALSPPLCRSAGQPAGARYLPHARGHRARLRDYLDGEDFLEVETPILQPVYGGAAARPFVTHHNQLHQDLYLRISFELYLKRLIVGGYDRVYEIGRDFRNEGVSFKHNPEFTQLEFYEAYADYQDVMRRTEEMVAYVAQQVMGGLTLTWQGHTIDLTPPWRRVPLRQAILDATGIDYEAYPTPTSCAPRCAVAATNPTRAAIGASWWTA
jgi:lysyl-tRNA synthetase class 2